MMDINLSQSLLLQPDTPYRQVAEVLRRLGFIAEAPSRPALLPGEPECVSWHFGGQKPFVIYSYNPVVHLRVLDVATVPPALRGAIAAELPLLTYREVDDLLLATDPRARLLGLWAAQETERLDLIPQLTRLSHDPVPHVAEQARVIAARFARTLDARENLMLTLRMLAEAAAPLIRQLDDPRLTTALKPTPGELAQLFDPELAGALVPAVEAFFAEPPLAAPGDGYPELKITAANAGLLRWPNELSEAFPRGYRAIAGWMNPSVIWCSWRCLSTTGASVQFDGLAWLDTRWIWLPKAFRLVSPLLAAPAPGTALH